MKKAILLFGVIFNITPLAFCQISNNQWITSNYLINNSHTLIDFSFGNPDTSTVISSCRFFLTNSNICDSTGNLFIYTNGNSVYNRNHDTLLNSGGINPGWATDYYLPGGMGIPQGSLILPYPGNSGKYLLFYVSGELCSIDTLVAAQPINLSYSIIDGSLDFGNGGIIANKKNLHAFDDTLIYGRISCTRHGNGRDWWIVTHKSNSDLYNILLVTPDTMLLHQQQIGRLHNYEAFTMQSSFSTQGDKYVLGLTTYLTDTFPNIIDLLDFDRCTGYFSNFRSIVIPDSEYVASGNCFSPDGRWLYVNTNQNIYQFDTWMANINNSRTVVASCDTLQNINCAFFFQQLGPDNKIYVTNYISADYLHVIDQPNQQGISCNVIQGGLNLPVLNSFVLPNYPNLNLGNLGGSICDTLTNINEQTDLVNFNIYPNPTFSNIIVEYETNINDKFQLILKSNTGNIVLNKLIDFHSNRLALDLSNFTPGIYFLQLLSNKEVQTKMLVLLATY